MFVNLKNLDLKDKSISDGMKHISVIICSHTRKEFIIDAVKSVSNQTMTRSYYEIIIVKNFRDSEIDSKLSTLSDQVFIVDDDWQGEKWWIGIKAAKGKLLCFLDDDDLFLPYKLEEVWRMYSTFKFSYLRHDLSSFTNLQDSQIFQGVPHEAFIASTVTINKKKGMLAKLAPTLTSSSGSCIERELCLNYKDSIKQIKIAFDQLLFYIALESYKGLAVTNAKLSLYRIHNSFTGIQTSNINDSMDKIADKIGIFQKDHATIRNCISKRNLVRLFENDDFNLNIIGFLIEKAQRPSIKSLFNYIVYPAPGRRRLKIFFLTIYFISFFNKQNAKVTYLKLLSKSRTWVKIR